MNTKIIAEGIRALSRASGSIAKMSVLSKYAHVDGFKDVLKFIYNPYHKTGISEAKLSKPTIAGNNATDLEFADAIEYFSTHQTGTDLDISYAKKFIGYTLRTYGSLEAEVARALVTQNLKVGVTATTLNKIYGDGFIPKVGCMLGTLYGNVGPVKTQWPCIITEKLDGVRRMLVKENGKCTLYSRSGHIDTGLVEVLKEAEKLPDNFMYDGELLAKGTFNDSIAQRQATNSLANMSGNKTGLIFNIFDMVPIKDFYAGKCDIPARERKIRLAATFNDESLQFIDEDWARRIAAFGMHETFESITTVPILGLVNNLTEAEPIVNAIWARGGEGIMLNTSKGPYEVKRSKHLLKVKHTEEYVLPIVDFVEGTNKYEDSLGAVVVKYKDSYVGVGSGFTDAQRDTIWQNKEKFIGRKIEVETFGESTNASGGISLNCPIFKRFVGDE